MRTSRDTLPGSLYRENRSYHKGEEITSYGQIENYLYYLDSGIVRFYAVREGTEITFDFAFSGNFFSAYTSFLSREPSMFVVEAITDVRCRRISHSQLQEVYAHNTDGERMGRLAAEQLFLKKTAREVELLTLSPEERYRKLLRQQPEMLREIPLKFLASYLGVAPETLSRIRRRIS